MQVVSIEGPLGAFVIPAEPEVTREHARWICEMVWRGEYDAPGLPDAIPAGSTVVDIGSHCGAFAVWAAARWSTANTFECFDPNVAACAIAKRNAPFARVHPVAVTSSEQPRFGLPPDWGSAKTHGATDGVLVPAVHPGDLPAAYVLKCDAEGVEPEVFAGYAHWGAIAILLYEYHSLEDRKILGDIAAARGFRNLRE